MTEDLGVGRSLREQLCQECRPKLEGAINRWDLFHASTPTGYTALLKKIERYTCASCQEIIVNAARRGPPQ